MIPASVKLLKVVYFLHIYIFHSICWMEKPSPGPLHAYLVYMFFLELDQNKIVMSLDLTHKSEDITK